MMCSADECLEDEGCPPTSMMCLEDECELIDDDDSIAESDVEILEICPDVLCQDITYYDPFSEDNLKLITSSTFSLVIQEIASAANAFWVRHHVRRQILKKLAEECGMHRNRVRRKCAFLRHDAARRRLEALRSGNTAAHAEMLAEGAGKETRLRAVMEETERILSELGAPLVPQALEELEQPKCMPRGKMMKHQLLGMSWLVRLVENHTSGILADDMGLGKTVQALGFLAYLHETLKEKGPYLIIVPSSLVAHWESEIGGWLPTIGYQTMSCGVSHMIQNLTSGRGVGELPKPIALITYDQVIKYHKSLKAVPWFITIVDEGQRLKNHSSRFTETCSLISSKHRVLLSGTPVQNSLRELWSLMTFVAPHAFSSLADFEQWFALPAPPKMKLKLKDANPDANAALEAVDEEDDGTSVTNVPPAKELTQLLSEEEELLVIQRLHRVLRPFILRRTKEMVDAQLPKKREEVAWVPLTCWQRSLYRHSLQRICEDASHGGATVGRHQAHLINLRKAVNHPYHFLPQPVSDHPVCSNPDNLFRASGKLELIDRIVPRLVKFGHKVLIFAQMTSLLDLLGPVLKKQGIECARIDGSMQMHRRKIITDEFSTGRALQVLLLSVRAAGVGLNLQAADTVILFDSDWNPQVDLQAMDRAHRIGQTREVVVLRLMTPSNLDVGILRRTGRKLEIEKKVIHAGQFHNAPTKPTNAFGQSHHSARETLLKSLVQEARSSPSIAAHAAVSVTPLKEINRMLARSEAERRAWDAEDDALLGPEAATQSGAGEGTAERLERCGRLISKSEVPRMTVARSVNPRKGRKPLKIVKKRRTEM